MPRKKRQSNADLALGKMPAEAPIRRTVAKDEANAWPEIMEIITDQAWALLHKHVAKIHRAHDDAKEVDEPQDTYRFNISAIINDADPDNYFVEVKLSYPSAMREAFSAKTKDSSKSLVATSPDLVDQMDD